VIPRKRLLILVPVCIAGLFTLWSTEAAAQRRVIRRAPIRTVFIAAYSHPFHRYYYDPFAFGWYGPQYRPYPPHPRYFYEPAAELRVQVAPREAEVYIDGYLAGNVDDFDGVFQRLRVPLGEHEVAIYREGYRTITEKMLFRPYQSYHIKQAMQPLAPGEAAEPRPVPDPNASSPAAGRAAPPGRMDPQGRPEPEGRADRFGSLAIRVQPGDAEVFVNGERWDTSPGENRLLLELIEGTHRVEIRKEGFKTYSSTVRVRQGETVTLNVSLSPGG
jgi:hypothetical protein